VPCAPAEQLGLVLGGRPRFVGGEERGADLHSVGTQRKRGDDPPGIGDAAGCDDRRRHLLDRDPDERQRSDQRVLRRREEGSAMTARLGSGRDDDVDAGLVERHCLIRRRGGREGDDSGVPEGGEHTLVGDAEDDAECRRPSLEDRFGLVLEGCGEALGIRWRGDTELGVQRLQPPDRRVEALTGHLALGQVVGGDPEVQREGAPRRRVKRTSDIANPDGVEVVDAERPEAAGVSDGGGQRHARQPAAERSLDERPIEIQEPADAGVWPLAAETG
jgi:hypothetical protein